MLDAAAGAGAKVPKGLASNRVRADAIEVSALATCSKAVFKSEAFDVM
jgi:hypothetical protein